MSVEGPDRVSGGSTNEEGIVSVRILLVDDEPFILTATASLLRGAGHEVIACEQWTGVASAVHREHPDVVLLDYNMPAIKGDELCRILKRNSVNPDMKVLIFSSEPEHDLVEIVSRSGADGYIPKNIAGHILLQRINASVSCTVN
ncbi:MAG: response regulator [Actinobacteria bacterium]|nr:MAG: response regulator [Actinomycetota bacterium]